MTDLSRRGPADFASLAGLTPQQARERVRAVRAQRPWFRKKRYMAPVMMLAVIAFSQYVEGDGSEAAGPVGGGSAVVRTVQAS